MISPPFIGMSPGSFALHTLTHRLPKILDDIRALPGWGSDAQRRLADLRDTLPNGVLPAPPLPDAVDNEYWNDWLGVGAGARWLDLSFFHAETVFYHLILAAVGYVDEASRDPFAEKKRAGLLGGGEEARRLGEWLERPPAAETERLIGALGIALSANRADLSQLSISSHEAELIVDDRPRASAILHASSVIDYVLDNAGVELLGDLALIDVLLRSPLGARVRVHCKPQPFFVSDATVRDCRETIDHLEGHAHTAVSAWGRRISSAASEGRLELTAHPFWCRPLHLTELPVDLRALLQQSRLVVLKGDLNYRRYLEDRAWPHDLPAPELRLRELPPALTVRVLKSELMVGLLPERVAALSARAPEWLTSGAFAAIQLFD